MVKSKSECAASNPGGAGHPNAVDKLLGLVFTGVTPF
jgi:hypothetical protein